MCGIAGLWDRRRRTDTNALAADIEGMTQALAHRGPDAGDFWIDDEAGLALGHRRLSIIDLSPAGAQPMMSSCGRFVISYNGEVFNADELRPELELTGRRFRGHSDTEVIIEGIAHWGVADTVNRLIGMFAMAIWDRKTRTFYLVRDRLGIKPVYWWDIDGCLLFGSELKALRSQNRWTPKLDQDALTAYLRFGYVPTPLTIYRGVEKLSPGTMLTASENGAVTVVSYWSLHDIASTAQATRFRGDENEAAEALDALLRDAVRRRMVADVPLGAFLSGGIDSSTVVALMQAQSARPVRTYSIGFDESDYDEAKNASSVARHLGTEHAELYASPSLALNVIPQLADMFDEPFADSSQIPTYLVSKLTREHVTVALSGDGGDELFGGYTRYFRSEALWRRIEATPRSLRQFAARGVRALSPAAWTAIGDFIPERSRPAQFGDKMHKLAGVLAGASEASPFYQQVMSLWPNPQAVVINGRERCGLFEDAGLRELIPDFTERMQYLDTLTYLPDDILTKVDRASMAVSLEARVPLLDHRVVAFTWSLPPAMKTANGIGKSILRRVLHKYVPRTLVERPKRGFAVPMSAWLRNELRDWAEPLLAERRLAEDGIFEPAPIRQRWKEHLEGRRNWQSQLWAVLMFQAWKERWLA